MQSCQGQAYTEGGESGSERRLLEASAIAQAHCPDGGRASGLRPQGVLAVSGHLWPLCEEEMEVECVNVINQGKRTDLKCGNHDAKHFKHGLTKKTGWGWLGRGQQAGES